MLNTGGELAGVHLPGGIVLGKAHSLVLGKTCVDLAAHRRHQLKHLLFDPSALLRIPLGEGQGYRDCDDVGSPPRLKNEVSDALPKLDAGGTRRPRKFCAAICATFFFFKKKKKFSLVFVETDVVAQAHHC